MTPTVATADNLMLARCLDCGYMLRGLVEHRCPECGRRFDPHNRATMRFDRQWIRFVMEYLLSLVPVSAFATVFGAGMFGLTRIFGMNSYECEALRFVIAPPLFAGWWARRRIRRAMMPRETSPRSERFFTRSIVITAAVCVFLSFGGVREWGCVHGSGLGVGPVGIAFSDTGGPCRNHVVGLKSWHVCGNFYVWTR